MHVALLRGINVGGKNSLPMVELVRMFEAAGCGEVKTYIQSGNVVFRSENVAGLGARISEEIAGRLGLRVPVILRSAVQMRSAVAKNPFVKAGVAAELLHVYFLGDAGSAAAVKGLDVERSPGDSFAVVGREVYLHLPNGVARTKLTNVYFDKALGTVSTMRNWRTVGVLAGMMGV
ncbi:DUF1697 domain-containing protein [Granulicella arctica]|uniref:Uncharacterized protein (DUF1697 family) n=1 Tax=Granulicella arctica TaxID=940613 RepID=A0A7Y9TS01_9BACT|nr:DUF1697 domain-containing protein [Granulicella arctica]NYF78628.1 uncharacterized protein (DUF1697 family) [Granulicella arctica]